MASEYSPTLYLLDRANIQDTLTNMYHCVDQHQWDELASEVFASEMVVDYTSIFGGEPQKVKGKDQAELWKGMVKQLTSSQHLMMGVMPELPQPGSKEVPMKAKASANVLTSLKKGDDKLMRNGTRGWYELVRNSDETSNPWRIAFLKAEIMWESGDKDIMSEIAASG